MLSEFALAADGNGGGKRAGGAFDKDEFIK
jgi:hypothetical protein